MIFRCLEIPAKPGGSPGITYVVTCQGIVVFTQEYDRHAALVERSPFSKYDIAWGGILTDDGRWVRQSLDFGDAPSLEQRETVTHLIQRQLNR